jgi:serine phosphatase RsbU (regulator of sigma subunit)
LARLRIVTPDGKMIEHELTEEGIVIGRSSRAGISLPDPALSREHARVGREDGHWIVEDLKSRNGTFLGGRRLEGKCPIEPDQTLQMGGCSLVIEEAPSPAHSSGIVDGTIFRPATELLDLTRQVPAEGKPRAEESLRRYAERLKLVFDLQQSLARSEAMEELLDHILDGVFHHLRPEQGAVFLKEPGGGFRRAAARSSTPGGAELELSRSLVREVAEKGLAAISLDVRVDERFAQAASMLDAGVRSLLAAPLLGPEGSLGLIALCSKANVRTFTEEDLELLVSLASVAALRLRNIQLAAAAAEQKRLQAEVALARRIQLALLPDRLPELSGYALHGGSVPSMVASGDFYKAVGRNDGRECVLFLADVSGKGLAAALVTASLEALSAGPLETGLGPAETFDGLSRRLFERTTPEKYATAFLAILEAATGKVTYANAGHNPALLLRASGESEWLGATGTPLGLLPGVTYGEREVSLEPGDALMIYTDGITEATNPEGAEYGKERLAEALRAGQGISVAEAAARLEADLMAFVAGVPFADDRTLLIVRRDPASVAR